MASSAELAHPLNDGARGYGDTRGTMFDLYGIAAAKVK
jgi:hypothetical protein